MSDYPYGRRSTQVRGFVKFPTHLENDKQGGMFVRLVVMPTINAPRLDNNLTEDMWDYYRENKEIVCTGGMSSFIYDEVFYGTDDKDWTSWWEQEGKLDEKRNRSIEEEHFPYINSKEEDMDSLQRYGSVQYLAVITMGSTGWSGRFRCTYDDLTDEGKELYNNIQKLDPTGKLVLQTGLDT